MACIIIATLAKSFKMSKVLDQALRYKMGDNCLDECIFHT